MAAVQQALLIAGAAPAGAYWNAADKSPDVVLSDGGRVARNTVPLGQLRGVRGVVGHTTGVWDVEFATEPDYLDGDQTDIYAGVATAAVALTGQPIFSALGGSYVAVRGNTQYGYDGGYAGTTGGIGWAAADGVQVLRLRVDVDNRTVDIYDYGGHRDQVMFGDNAGAPVFPWAQMSDLSGAGVRLRLLAEEFTLPVSGGTPWGTGP